MSDARVSTMQLISLKFVCRLGQQQEPRRVKRGWVQYAGKEEQNDAKQAQAGGNLKIIEGFGQQESAGPFGRSKWPLSYCLKHVKGASRTQTGSDCSRPSWGAPKAADLGFGLGLQLWARPVPVEA